MADASEQQLIDRIRQGDENAWQDLINLYEGRLLSFAKSRLGNLTMAEDVVQEALIGFLTSLPNYDESQSSLQAFLFRITAHKITDSLRKQGRRPSVQFSEDSPTLAGEARKASSMARSREKGNQQRDSISDLLLELITQWKADKNFERLKCCELLFVRGWPNIKVAQHLGLSEQQVANHKQVVIQRLKKEGNIHS